MVITEAMACRLPCVTYDISVFKSIYHGINKAVNLHDKTSFSQEIIKLLKDKEYAASLGAKGQKFVHSRYTWDIIADNELNIIKESAR